MQPLHYLRKHLAIVAAAFALGIAAWLAYESLRADDGPDAEFAAPIKPIRSLPPSPPPPTSVSREVRPGVVTADLLPRLQPGMARVEVEELIGAPPAQFVFPVTNVDGRFIYRASYLANLDPMPTSTPRGPIPRSTISLDFDASRTGHPLVKVHVADNMS